MGQIRSGTPFVLFFLTGLFQSVFSFANLVTEKEAESAAIHFYQTVISSAQVKAPQRVSAKLTYTENMPGGKTPAFYVFNMAPKGFVIISAEDAAEPIQGYSTKGLFNSHFKEHENGFQDWATSKASVAKILKSKSVQAPSHLKTIWNSVVPGKFAADSVVQSPSPLNNADVPQANLGAGVAPLVTADWGQDWPYNYDTPADPWDSHSNPNLNGDGVNADGTATQWTNPTANGNGCHNGTFGHPVAGCVATSAAQIMNFWKYPSSGTGIKPYTRDKYGVISASGLPTTFDWANMSNTYPDVTWVAPEPAADASTLAVANLIFQVGIASAMQYGNCASEAFFAAPFVANFGYDPSTIRELTMSTLTNQAIAQLEGELNAGRPINIGSYKNGHAFVLDGYDSFGNLHFNFGWNGNNNGYFNPKAPTGELEHYYDPGSTLVALVGIQPLKAGAPAAPTNLVAQMATIDHSIKFVWNLVPAAKKYLVKIKKFGDLTNKHSETTLTGAVSSFAVPAYLISACTQYEFTVQSINGSGVTSNPQTPVQFSTYCPPVITPRTIPMTTQ